MDSTALPHLHNAIKRGDLKAVLDAADESNVNAVYNGHTAMTYALDVSADDNVITKALLTSPHFDPNAGNRHQRTPLFEAAKHGRDEIVTCLLRMGAKVDICDHRGMTPLGICAVYNRHTTARLLLNSGADVQARDWNGDTPLHCACSHGSEEVIVVLLNQPGCDVSSVNNKGQTPLMLGLPSAYNVQVQGQPLSRALSICERLLEARNGVGASSNNCSSLYDRVTHNDVAGASLLLHHCPQLVDFTDAKGLTPLEMTLSLEGPGHHEMALCLLHHGASPGRLLPASVPGTHGSLTNTSCDPSQNNGFKQSGTDPLLVCTDSRGTDTDEFHKLRFLEALLAATFVTPGNLWRLVLLGLLTPESLEVVQAALEGRESDCGRGSSDEAAAAEQDQAYNDTSSCRTNDAAAAEYVCAAVPRSLTLQHQCRLLVRRMLASSGLGFRVALSCLGLPQRVQNYISLGQDMNSSSPLHVAQLHVAITENDVSKVRQLLEAGVEVNAPFMEHTPLTRALELQPSHHDDSLTDSSHSDGLCGDQINSSLGEEAEGTLQAGEAVNDQDDERIQDEDVVMSVNENKRCSELADIQNFSSLSLDEAKEHDVITLLLRHGASLSQKDPQGDTPLHVAARRGAFIVRRFLADVFASPPDPSVSPPVVCQRPAASSVPAPRSSPTSCENSIGVDDQEPKLHYSQALRQRSLNPTVITDRSGLTPLETALSKGDLDTVRLLLLWIISLSAPPTPQANTAVHTAGNEQEDGSQLGDATAGQMSGQGEETSKEKRGFNTQDSEGRNANVQQTIANEDVKKMDFFPQNQASSETSGPRGLGRTSHCLAENTHTGDSTARTEDTFWLKTATWVGTTGVTALHCATAAGLPGLTETLIALGCPVNAADTLGNTPLSVASTKGAVYARSSLHSSDESNRASWRSRLRVWPKFQPHPFPDHALPRPTLQASRPRDDKCGNSAPAVPEAAQGLPYSAQGPCPGAPHAGVIRSCVPWNQNVEKRFSRVSYQLTVDVLSRHGAQ